MLGAAVALRLTIVDVGSATCSLMKHPDSGPHDGDLLARKQPHLSISVAGSCSQGSSDAVFGIPSLQMLASVQGNRNVGSQKEGAS